MEGETQRRDGGNTGSGSGGTRKDGGLGHGVLFLRLGSLPVLPWGPSESPTLSPTPLVPETSSLSLRRVSWGRRTGRRPLDRPPAPGVPGRDPVDGSRWSFRRTKHPPVRRGIGVENRRDYSVGSQSGNPVLPPLPPLALRLSCPSSGPPRVVRHRHPYPSKERTRPARRRPVRTPHTIYEDERRGLMYPRRQGGVDLFPEP